MKRYETNIHGPVKEVHLKGTNPRFPHWRYPFFTWKINKKENWFLTEQDDGNI